MSERADGIGEAVARWIESRKKNSNFLGDLSYADNHPNHDNVRWDTWGRFVERNNAYEPWIWATGNNELDYAPELVSLGEEETCGEQRDPEESTDTTQTFRT
ncbi:hypothetical protein LR48_Vigan02g125000 [Vigna angularis]|uniref:Uncharacterized protein n=2 Tax=Phaseolus angularis TaxID=3914 RepID=A0A0L9TX33_PHAAN|nr:hypothetical protein LR48_Vigan02g125000 [Vigna angularis]BAT95532.1 hypothetical protein VIGAN_08228000 [Vigna angularis var. angularis]